MDALKSLVAAQRVLRGKSCGRMWAPCERPVGAVWTHCEDHVAILLASGVVWVCRSGVLWPSDTLPSDDCGCGDRANRVG